MEKLFMPKLAQVITTTIKNYGKDDDPKLSNMYNLVISSTIPIARTCLRFVKTLIANW
jgi:hypothetical protein